MLRTSTNPIPPQGRPDRPGIGALTATLVVVIAAAVAVEAGRCVRSMDGNACRGLVEHLAAAAVARHRTAARPALRAVPADPAPLDAPAARPGLAGGATPVHLRLPQLLNLPPPMVA